MIFVRTPKLLIIVWVWAYVGEATANRASAANRNFRAVWREKIARAIIKSASDSAALGWLRGNIDAPAVRSNREVHSCPFRAKARGKSEAKNRRAGVGIA